jgi:hypothetical protein
MKQVGKFLEVEGNRRIVISSFQIEEEKSNDRPAFHMTRTRRNTPPEAHKDLHGPRIDGQIE